MERRISFDQAAALARSGNSEAQYVLSSALHRRGRFEESLHWLRQAAAQKLIPAQMTLAILLMDGRQCPRDHRQAIELLQPLAASDVQASLLLGELHGFAVFGGNDRETGLRFLFAAAQLGHAGALRQLALLSLCHQRMCLARPLLDAAARRGDGAAAYAAARCDADGIGGAAEPGIDWTSLEEALPQLAADLPLPAPELLHEAPLIRKLPGVFHPLVLDTLIHWAAPLVQRSMIIDARTGEARADPMRNSSHVTVNPRQHDHVLEALERCIASVSGVPPQHGEFLQILRYRPGEEFKPHVDYFNEGAAGTHRSLADGGQRAQTVLIYLNRDYDGGSTLFPSLRITIDACPGDLLHFHNLGSDGLGHTHSLHAGLPVTAGEKWLLSQWIRSKPYPPRLAW